MNTRITSVLAVGILALFTVLVSCGPKDAADPVETTEIGVHYSTTQQAWLFTSTSGETTTLGPTLADMIDQHGTTEVEAFLFEKIDSPQGPEGAQFTPPCDCPWGYNWLDCFGGYCDCRSCGLE